MPLVPDDAPGQPLVQPYNPPSGTTTSPQSGGGSLQDLINAIQGVGGTGSSGGGGAGASAGSNASAKAALTRYFLNLGLPSSLSSWAFSLMKKGWSMEGILAQLYKKNEFKNAFPGIFNAQGGLIVSPQEYLQLSEAYKSIAAQYGFSLTKAQIGKAVQGQLSVDEFKFRARGVQIVNTVSGGLRAVQQVVASFNAEQKAQGKPGIKVPTTAGEAMDFVLGKSDQRVYEVYEGAYALLAGKAEAYAITPDQARKVANMTEGTVSIEEYGKLFGQARAAGAELSSFGVTSAVDLFDPNKRRLVEQALKQRQAMTAEDLAAPQLGLQGGRPVLAGGPSEAT